MATLGGNPEALDPRAVVEIGADDGTRTRDPDFGKVVRYQLRHVRVYPVCRVVPAVIDARQGRRSVASG